MSSALHFGWRLLINRIVTRDNLSKRGFSVVNLFCVMCRKEKELVQHLFFECNVTWKIWKLCDKWVSINSIHHNSTREHLSRFSMPGMTKEGNKIWKSMCVTIVWSIWTHRNSIVYRCLDNDEVLNVVQINAWIWIINKIPKVQLSYSNWWLCAWLCIKFSISWNFYCGQILYVVREVSERTL